MTTITTITINKKFLEEIVELFDSAISTRYPHEILRDIRAALSATAPAAASESLMTEIDYADDDALRFIQRVLESDAPESDKKSARDMVVEIRTRVLKARTSKPAAAPATAPEQMPLERDCICHQDLHIDGYSGGAAPEGLYGALWVVVEGVGKKYVLADQSSEPKDMLAPATAPEPSTEVAVGKLCKSLREDLDYAWAWHCNIAMAAFDAGCPHDVANEGAARFMQLLAGVDTREHPAFQGTQDHPMRNDKTALAQPARHDAPTCEGMWISDDFEGISTFNSDDLQAFQKNTGVRWYGPIPEDKP